MSTKLDLWENAINSSSDQQLEEYHRQPIQECVTRGEGKGGGEKTWNYRYHPLRFVDNRKYSEKIVGLREVFRPHCDHHQVRVALRKWPADTDSDRRLVWPANHDQSLVQKFSRVCSVRKTNLCRHLFAFSRCDQKRTVLGFGRIQHEIGPLCLQTRASEPMVQKIVHDTFEI